MFYNNSKKRYLTEQEVKDMTERFGHRFLLNFATTAKQKEATKNVEQKSCESNATNKPESVELGKTCG